MVINDSKWWLHTHICIQRKTRPNLYPWPMGMGIGSTGTDD
jgi:hypothetical protein